MQSANASLKPAARNGRTAASYTCISEGYYMYCEKDAAGVTGLSKFSHCPQCETPIRTLQRSDNKGRPYCTVDIGYMLQNPVIGDCKCSHLSVWDPQDQKWRPKRNLSPGQRQRLRATPAVVQTEEVAVQLVATEIKGKEQKFAREHLALKVELMTLHAAIEAKSQELSLAREHLVLKRELEEVKEKLVVATRRLQSLENGSVDDSTEQNASSSGDGSWLAVERQGAVNHRVATMETEDAGTSNMEESIPSFPIDEMEELDRPAVASWSERFVDATVPPVETIMEVETIQGDDTVFSNLDGLGVSPTQNMYLWARSHPGLVTRSLLRHLRRVELGAEMENQSDAGTNIRLLDVLVSREQEHGIASIFDLLGVSYVTIPKHHGITTAIVSWCKGVAASQQSSDPSAKTRDDDDVMELYESLTRSKYNRERMGEFHGMNGPLDPDSDCWNAVEPNMVFALPLALPISRAYLDLNSAESTRPVHVLLCFGRNLDDATAEIGGHSVISKSISNHRALFHEAPVVLNQDDPYIAFSSPNCLILCSSHQVMGHELNVVAHKKCRYPASKETVASFVSCGSSETAHEMELDTADIPRIQGLVVGYHLNCVTQGRDGNGNALSLHTEWSDRTGNVVPVVGCRQEETEAVDQQVCPLSLTLQSKWHYASSSTDPNEKKNWPKCCSHPLVESQIVKIRC